MGSKLRKPLISLQVLRAFFSGIHIPSYGSLNRKPLYEGEFTTGSQLVNSQTCNNKSPPHTKGRSFMRGYIIILILALFYSPLVLYFISHIV